MEVVGWGEREGVASYEGGSEFLVRYWGGGKNFSISHHEKCISFFFQIISFTAERHSQK